MKCAFNSRNSQKSLVIELQAESRDRMYYIHTYIHTYIYTYIHTYTYISGWIFEKVIDSYKPGVPSTPLPPSQTFQSQALTKIATV